MELLVGSLVRLAAIQREDLLIYTRWFRDYEVQRFLMPDVLTPQTEEAEAAWYERASLSTESYTFGIRTLTDDHVIGNCSLFEISNKNRVATFGIVVGDKEYWGKGYGADATRVMVHFAFSEANLNRVQLEVYAFNARAIRAYEKVGFVHEGTRRAALFREGVYHDIHMMAILRDEWLLSNS